MKLKKWAMVTVVGLAWAMALPGHADQPPAQPAPAEAHGAAGADGSDHAKPENAKSEPAKPAAAGSSAVDASKVSSTGIFTAPELKIPQRPAFGAKAGKAEEYPAVKEAV